MSGPLAGLKIVDLSSLMSGPWATDILGDRDTDGPRLDRTIVPDKLSAVVGAQALAAGLLARERTGRGQHIRLSMLDSVLSFLWASDMGAYTFVDKPVPVEKGGSFIDLIYQTADGYMTVATNSNAEWQGLCRAIGHPEWIEDERLSSPVGRHAYIHERLARVQSVLTGKTTSQWLEPLDRNDVPAAPTPNRTEGIEHPQGPAAWISIAD